ncbi:hypothetical protein HYV49_05990 [Candidatus Pacearchaeota archaeon]|nr:hypothetical protein [Candidatus Pacearchaeota archaeon]
MDKTKEAYESAVKVLEKCATPSGFRAAYPGYNGIWARDSMITSLGASLLGDKFKETIKQSLITLAKNQSEKGQIPNAILLDNNQVDFKSIDSALWFVIGYFNFKQKFNESVAQNSVNKAITWLSYQDMGEDGMLEQLPTTDWQDAFPHRYGHTINTQALYYKVLNLTGEEEKSEKLKNVANNHKEDKLWNGQFYLPWRWKNHNKYKEQGNWFDSLGNLLAIVFELADKSQADKILAHIKRQKINLPYPLKAIYPPIKKGSKDWQDYFNDCDAKNQYNYLNAGIWTFIGGFYILALIKQKQFKEAEHELQKLAEANMKGNFSEWLHGKTGKTGSKANDNQAWNAGMYISAYESLKRKECLV